MDKNAILVLELINNKSNKRKEKKMINQLIKLIECFDDNNKMYWINKLHTPDSVKGYLIIHFKL